MKFCYRTLDGEDVSGKISANNTHSTRSNLHIEARKIITECLPLAQVFEEVSVTLLYRKTPVYFDFFIPVNNLFIEVQGQQHSNYVKFFHKNKREFLKSQARDKSKIEWCSLNNFKILEFKFNEKDQWKQILSSSR